MDWGLARDYAARDVHAGEMSVTETEWLAATDREAIVDFLGGKPEVCFERVRDCT
jgi:hypothetical protein